MEIPVRSNHVLLMGIVVLSGIAVGGVAAAESSRLSGGRRPNIILIVADDLGYADVGFNGCRDIPTPHIDSLARRGVRITNGYVSCPVCSPTRAGLMTGRYQQRFGHEFNTVEPAIRNPKMGLPLDEQTLPQLLKAAGYHTGMVGKWHLGGSAGHHPQARGFDRFFGFLGGAHSYIDARAEPTNLIYRGSEPVDEKAHLTEAFRREAIAFLDGQKKDEPYFLYLPFNAVHGPLQAPPEYAGRFSEISDERRRIFAGMLAGLDEAVGRVLDKVRERGEEERTLVFFISDNGGPTHVNSSRNDPLSGTKGQVWEGGIRVPFAVAWPGVLPAGKAYDEPVISLDILPTCLAVAAARGPDKPLDGVDLMPFLTGEKSGSPHDALYWRFGPQSAIRRGDWKLVRMGEEPAKLYDLKRDVSEHHDVSAEHPERVRELETAFQAWNRQLAEPLWKGRVGVPSTQAIPPPRPMRSNRGR